MELLHAQAAIVSAIIADAPSPAWEHITVRVAADGAAPQIEASALCWQATGGLAEIALQPGAQSAAALAAWLALDAVRQNPQARRLMLEIDYPGRYRLLSGAAIKGAAI
ncbi:hypothetical protein BTR14_06875 [Rhizobium rhizosphaerae]|uniref:Uncharacterized protein n=1 Tax=Xaviernesmea rhizosphaerae TaxID=1672749 RepID=A0ABX3PF39_9HYPH|nr:hypothetical protein [Xaviernesmea rhizosphaerae]OQP87144.1 hypothetical protein BTR14_06875 [Xaviernesmea rhizosphaerae]